VDTPSLISRNISRRQLLASGGKVAIAATGAGMLGTACSSAAATSSNQMTGTINFVNVPGWIGSAEQSGFQKLHHGVNFSNVAYGGSSTLGLAVMVRENPTAYDLIGAFGLAAVPDLQAKPDLIAKLDFANIPNIKYIPEQFRRHYPLGTPTDYGKIGFGYRKDLMSERPTSWHDVWAIAPKYSGKIVFLDDMEDCMGNTLIMLGYSGNSRVSSQITAAKNKLIEIKPYLQAVLGSNVSASLVKGTAVLTMDWDFDIASARKQQPNIEWVIPEEGLMAYLEGWMAVAGTKHLRLIEEFMNYNLDPRVYANFVNTTGTAYLEPAANPYIMRSIVTDPILSFSPAVVSKITYEESKGNATSLWEQSWSEFLAA
jgi:spermidine/putrescine transport system substrate-binding protein